MPRRHVALGLLLATALSWAAARAQEGAEPEERAGPGLRAEVRLDRNRAAVGEPIRMEVTVSHEQDLRWEESSVPEILGPFEVRQMEGPVPAGGPEGEAEGGDRAAPAVPGTRWLFQVTAFELGELELPPFDLRYAEPGSAETSSVSTPAQKIEIVSTISEEDEEPADIRYGFSLPRDYTIWLWAGGLALLLGGLGYWLWRRWRLREPERPAVEQPGPPPRPAYERYREALEELLRRRLFETGQVKEFHVRISEIIKPYLGEVLGFDAVDRTTTEVMAELAGLAAARGYAARVGAFLDACDAVKFARHQPAVEEKDRTVEEAFAILDAARPSPRAAPDDGKAAGDAA